MPMKNVKSTQRILLTLAYLCMALLCANCSDSNDLSAEKSKNCVEPENPYEEDTGHYAGFKWAEENVEPCDGNSESFNDGCDEYYKQLESYEDCLKKSGKSAIGQ